MEPVPYRYRRPRGLIRNQRLTFDVLVHINFPFIWPDLHGPACCAPVPTAITLRHKKLDWHLYLAASGRCAESRHGKLTHRFLILTVNKSLVFPLECPRDKLIHLRNFYILQSEAALPDNQSWRQQAQSLQPTDQLIKILCRKFRMTYIVT